MIMASFGLGQFHILDVFQKRFYFVGKDPVVMLFVRVTRSISEKG
jgi:hypothetical protein